jgi:hypothetical protein
MLNVLRKSSHPVSVLLGCLLLSALEVGVLYLSSRFKWRVLDFGSLSIGFSLVVPVALSLVLPALMVLARASRLVAGVALCIFAIALVQLFRVALAQLVDPAVIAKTASASCLPAAQDPIPSSGFTCVGWSFLSQLALNSLWWAIPLALLVAMVRLYEHRQISGGRV